MYACIMIITEKIERPLLATHAKVKVRKLLYNYFFIYNGGEQQPLPRPSHLHAFQRAPYVYKTVIILKISRHNFKYAYPNYCMVPIHCDHLALGLLQDLRTAGHLPGVKASHDNWGQRPQVL